MKKNNKKGFILAETIAVATIVMSALVFIYVQFISINNSYYNSFKYNSVDNIYAIENIRNFLSTEVLDDLTTAAEENVYVDITDCSYEYFTEYPYCEKLFEALKVKTVIFAIDNVDEIKKSAENNVFSENLKTFIKALNYEKTYKYRIIVEFEDETCATLNYEGVYTFNGEYVLIGDLNKDNLIDAKDATMINQFINKIGIPTSEYLTASDVNKDGIVNDYDVSLIHEYRLGNENDDTKYIGTLTAVNSNIVIEYVEE